MSWGRRRSRSNDWGWPRYVPVAERKEKARKQAEKLQKKGQALSPVVIAGRTIAGTFWGKAWCENLERYGDYENRIPRGRAYVRNGSVVDLKIGTARVDALVSGTHLYSVGVEIRPLRAEVWKGIKGACTGRIGSLLELLQGKLSREVMEIVTRSRTGLFPEPAEISFHCSCPDWASMCKHVAAVLYGIGARLDREPELLFRLRDLDHRELIAAPGAADLAASPGMREKMIDDEELAGIFGIEIDERPAAPVATPPERTQRSHAVKPVGAVETPEPVKRKRGRPRLAPEEVKAPLKPRRGRPPRVRAELPLPRPVQKESLPVETPETRLRQARGPQPAIPVATPPERTRRSRTPKTAGALETPEPVKRKRGRPRAGSKPISEERAAPMPELEELKQERPRLRPAFLRGLRRRKAEETAQPLKKSAPRKGDSARDAANIPNPSPARKRRGRPPGKGKA